jgi:hypothetical protein
MSEAGSMVQVDASAKFADLRPVKRRPRLYHLLGFGLYLYGDRDFDMDTQSFVRTLCFCLLYIPVVAFRSFRVTPTDEGWRYLGVVPLSRSARSLSLASAIVLLAGGGFIGVNAYWNSPHRVAERKLAEADRLLALGRVRDAVLLLADVAVSPSERAAPTAKRLAKLLVADPSIKDQEGLGEMLSAAVKVQKVKRWPGSAEALQKRGVDLARTVAAKDQLASMSILDAVAPLAPEDPSLAETRHGLLEKIVTANPSDVGWATRLALSYESKGELDRCGKLLEPMRAQLGESEGARILALADARNDHIDKALPLLRAYTKGRLERLKMAEDTLRSLYQSAQTRIMAGLEHERAPDFEYNRYRNASESKREKILIDYLESKIKGDPDIEKAQQALMAESGVTQAALELGLMLLQSAQAQSDPEARKSLLNEAESTFLAVSHIAGDSAEYQLSLGQVYYWQGKHAEGRKILDQALAASNRDPGLLLQVSSLLRSVGSNSEARKLAEEGYGKAAPGPIKSNCAVIRGLLGDDLEDRIVWLKRGDTNNPNTRAMLDQDLANQALQKGNKDQAILHLKSALSTYESMPESASILNNTWIALNQLAKLTGDDAARRRATAMIEKAAALESGNSLTLFNASSSLLEEAMREMIGPAIDFTVIKDQPDLNMLHFLAKDERSMEAIAARVRTHPGVIRALSVMDKVVLLAPRNPSSYQMPRQVLAFRRDVPGLRKLFATLSRTEVDLADNARRATDVYAGKMDAEMKSMAQSNLKYAEIDLPPARAKGGLTFAVAVANVVIAGVMAAGYGLTVDPDATVALAEEAFASSPSLASRWYLTEALFLRAIDRLAKGDQSFAQLRDRSRRSVSQKELIAAVLSRDGPLKQAVLKNADVIRAVDLLRESFEACPRYTSGPVSWMMFRSRHPDVAAAVAKAYGESELDLLEGEIDARLRPYDPSETLNAYLRAIMENKGSVAIKIAKDAKSRGIPLPVDNPFTIP